MSYRHCLCDLKYFIVINVSIVSQFNEKCSSLNEVNSILVVLGLTGLGFRGSGWLAPGLAPSILNHAARLDFPNVTTPNGFNSDSEVSHCDARKTVFTF